VAGRLFASLPTLTRYVRRVTISRLLPMLFVRPLDHASVRLSALLRLDAVVICASFDQRPN
jgi:hypothetical protein